MSGLKGMSRLPGDTVRARRNATKFASDFTSLLGDGLTVDTSLIVIDLAADKGLEFIAGELATKIQSPLICDAAGLGIDPGNGLEISGTELVVDLAATSGLEFSGGDLICKVAAPIALDATGIHLDYTTGLTLSGTNLVLDILGLTTDTITAGDWVPFHDLADAPNKIAFSDFEATLNHDALANFVGNEHIDWTNATDNLVTTGYGDFSALYLDGIREMFTPGTNNICIGQSAGSSLTTGTDNVFLGQFSGNESTEISYNLFFGASSGRSHLTGEHNVAIGFQAFKTGIAGDKNMIFGTQAGYVLIGNENVMIGQEAGYSETTGSYNVLIGRRAGYRMKADCDYNTFIGWGAGYSGAASSNANQNTVIGAVAGNSLTTGDYNTSIGVESLHDLTTGLLNSALGRQSGHGQSTGDYNVYLGALAGLTNHTYNNSIALGYHADFIADNQFVIGSVESPITTMYIGEGVVSTTPQDVSLNATGGSGTNIAAGDFIIAGGKGTGDADPGDILFQTSTAGAAGVVLQTLSTRMKIDGDGNTSIGDGGVTNYAQFKADGELNLYGTARVTRHLRVGAAQWDKGAAAPVAGFEGVFSTLDFDAATDDEAHFTVIVPYRWDNAVDIEFAVDWFYDGVQDDGTVCWGLEYKAVKTGEAVTGAGTTITKISAGTHTTGQMVRTIFTTKILAANLEAGDTLGFRLYRDVSGDTLAADARLINTHFHFMMDKLGQAT